MMRHAGMTLITCAVAACGSSESSADYGPPTAETVIRLEIGNGFLVPGSPEILLSVEIVGTQASYVENERGESAQATLEASTVASIIHAFESIDLLEIDSEAFARCPVPPLDAGYNYLHVVLSAGTKDLQHIQGCAGAVFADVDAVENQIFDLSGFKAWYAAGGTGTHGASARAAVPR